MGHLHRSPRQVQRSHPPRSTTSSFYGLTFFAPNINIFRDPRWGRGQETYGEDPFLTARWPSPSSAGMQGTDPKYFRVVSTPKHFDVHSGPESTRHRANVDVSAHDLEDTYLPASRAAVTEANAQSVMCAYNAIDGAPACANTMLLRDHLRDAWHFSGFVVSDCAAVADIDTGHHYAPDMAHASADAVKAGTDLECGFGTRPFSHSPTQSIKACSPNPTSTTPFAASFARASNSACSIHPPPSRTAASPSPK